jgi:predicted AlkP superfamily pyrophosphatase or phosphodiesterase
VGRPWAALTLLVAALAGWSGAIALAAAAPPAAGHAAASTDAPAPRHLVLITIDGLRPEFYLDPTYPAPTLRALAAAGSAARAVEPVFPSVTYPAHASIVTGVRPSRHGVLFNVRFEPPAARGRWYEDAADLRAPPLWEWARAAGLRTAGVSWPSTRGARIDLLVPERDYYARPDPLPLLRDAATPGLFERTGVTPSAAIFRDVREWDAFLAATAVALIRDARPHLLLLHLVETDIAQHRGGREGDEVRPALARIDAHLQAIRQAIADAGLAARAVVVVTGDHGFQDVSRVVFPNDLLARAGLRGCPGPGERWRATAHVAGGAAAVFVTPPGDAEATRAAEAVLARHAAAHYTLLPRSRLDDLGAMEGAAFALEAAPGFAFGGGCGRGLTRARPGGAHGFLPSRATMATGFVAAGPGVRPGVLVEAMRLVDIAPTAARLLGLAAPAVEGRVLTEILE